MTEQVNASRRSTPLSVNVDNFARAESHSYFARLAREGGFGKLKHDRELAKIDAQTVIRLNRDTLYSFGVFDVGASSLGVVLPESGGRFMAVQVVNENHHTPLVFYAPDHKTLTREIVGTQYVCLIVRTFVDPNNPLDMKQVHTLQDAIRLEQTSVGELLLPEWDEGSLGAVRQALLGLVTASGGIDSARMFGTEEAVDPVQHLMGTAAGWGGNPRETALYEGITPKKNDGETAYALTLGEVPVDGFWSVSVYNEDGYFVANDRHSYTVNNVTAEKDPDGSVTVHFGGDENASNYIPIMPGWNYLLRMYRPRKALLEGNWRPPTATIVGPK